MRGSLGSLLDGREVADRFPGLGAEPFVLSAFRPEGGNEGVAEEGLGVERGRAPSRLEGLTVAICIFGAVAWIGLIPVFLTMPSKGPMVG